MHACSERQERRTMCSCLEKIRRKPWKNFVHDTVPQLMSDIMDACYLDTQKVISPKN